MNNENYTDETFVESSLHREVVLSAEQFREFYTFLNIIKPHFEDLCIVDGLFRSRSNDRSSIVETGFSYFENLNFCIAEIKLLVKMLSTLDKKDEITITIDDDNIIFTDSYQSVKIEKLQVEFADNEFAIDETMNQIFYENIDRENLLIKETQPKAVVCNINRMTRDLNAHSISVKHKKENPNKGYLFISNQTGYNNAPTVREYVIELKNDFIIPMKQNHSFTLVTLPFIFNKAEMTFNYYVDMDRPIIYSIYNTSVHGLSVNIYGRSSLIDESE
jgi:hypothetical protein